MELEWIRNDEVSYISDVNNRSFCIDDIENQFNEQITLINELKNELNNKNETIECLV